MRLWQRQTWVNFLALLPGTVLTVLTIAVAFLRFYDEQDFRFLGLIAQPRTWSNRLTVAALVVAVVNFGVEWDRRNQETDRLAAASDRLAAEEQRRAAEEQRRAAEEQRRVEEEQRRVVEEEQRRREEERRRVVEEEQRRAAEERRRREEAARAADQRTTEAERASRRARIEARCRAAQIRFQLDPSPQHRQNLVTVLALLDEYGETL